SGGRLIDSSPMYGSSQKVIGYGLTKLNGPPSLFSADKVWISSGARGPDQIEASRRFWGVPRFDLLQVHNLLSWEEHLRNSAAISSRAIFGKNSLVSLASLRQSSALCRNSLDVGMAALRLVNVVT